MAPVEAALDRLTDPTTQVSCHYLIHQTGRIDRLVPENKRAWHAGVSSWNERKNINDYSIGIELDSLGDVFPQPLMESLVWLVGDIRTRYPIANSLILGHSDVAPLRKDDPSEHFDWEFLARLNIGVFPTPAKIFEPLASTETLQQCLKNIGYGIELTGDWDQQTVLTLKAFQRHFRRQKVDGVLDDETTAMLRAVEELYTSL